MIILECCDLHTHSHYSDGCDSPRRLLELAQAAGLQAIALCDHNSVDGLPEFMEAGKDFDLEAVPGIEFSTEYQGIELHILGLYIRPEYYEAIRTTMDDLRADKERANRELVTALQKQGIDISYDAIRDNTPSGYVNRAHIAMELVRKGYASSFRDGFDRYLAQEKGFYVPPRRLQVFDAIRWIKVMGAAAVLAHPLLNLDSDQMQVFLPQAKDAGLDAMETLYPEYPDSMTRTAASLAKKYGILPSGGSDYHGDVKPGLALGTGYGDLAVPLSYLHAIRQRTKYTL